MKRSSVKVSVDKSIFRRTAVQVRRVNIAPKVSRGGIRL